MAEQKWYAWSPIQHTEVEGDTSGAVTPTSDVVQPGSVVSADSLGVSDADWAALVEAGSVRSYPFPDMPAEFTGSPIDFLRQQMRRVEEEPEALAETELVAVGMAAGSHFSPPLEETLADPEAAGIPPREELRRSQEEGDKATKGSK